jgi:DNA-directed RNA polymerase specialized sigma24 family protein
MLQRTLASEASGGALARATATDGCKEQIEQNILIRELLAPLTPDEQQVVPWKFFGFSSREIARRRGCTVNAVNLTFFHAKERIPTQPRRSARKSKTDCPRRPSTAFGMPGHTRFNG